MNNTIDRKLENDRYIITAMSGTVSQKEEPHKLKLHEQSHTAIMDLQKEFLELSLRQAQNKQDNLKNVLDLGDVSLTAEEQRQAEKNYEPASSYVDFLTERLANFKNYYGKVVNRGRKKDGRAMKSPIWALKRMIFGRKWRKQAAQEFDTAMRVNQMVNNQPQTAKYKLDDINSEAIKTAVNEAFAKDNTKSVETVKQEVRSSYENSSAKQGTGISEDDLDKLLNRYTATPEPETKASIPTVSLNQTNFYIPEDDKSAHLVASSNVKESLNQVQNTNGFRSPTAEDLSSFSRTPTPATPQTPSKQETKPNLGVVEDLGTLPDWLKNSAPIEEQKVKPKEDKPLPAPVTKQVPSTTYEMPDFLKKASQKNSQEDKPIFGSTSQEKGKSNEDLLDSARKKVLGKQEDTPIFPPKTADSKSSATNDILKGIDNQKTSILQHIQDDMNGGSKQPTKEEKADNQFDLGQDDILNKLSQLKNEMMAEKQSLEAAQQRLQESQKRAEQEKVNAERDKEQLNDILQQLSSQRQAMNAQKKAAEEEARKQDQEYEALRKSRLRVLDAAREIAQEAGLSQGAETSEKGRTR